MNDIYLHLTHLLNKAMDNPIVQHNDELNDLIHTAQNDVNDQKDITSICNNLIHSIFYYLQFNHFNIPQPVMDVYDYINEDPELNDYNIQHQTVNNFGMWF